MIKQLDEIFNPRSIAVIGASDDPGKMSYLTMKGFIDMGFRGELYPVSRNDGRPVHGRPVYKRVEDIPGEVDLAVVVVPPPFVPSVIKSCADKGVKGVVNFSTPANVLTGEEKDAIDYALAKGTRIIGPNSMGIYCPSSGLALFPDMSLESGDVSFISHSGGMGWGFAAYLNSRNMACNKVITVGNEWDLAWTDFLEYFGSDPGSEIICGYLEGVRDGSRFIEAAKKTASRKPVMVIKGGKSDAGTAAAASHTGSISGQRDIWDSVFKQTGVINVKDLDELIEHIIFFKFFKELPAGKRIGVVSGTGGPTVMAIDHCGEYGLVVPEFSLSTQERINEFLPAFGTCSRNPVDLSIFAAVDYSLYKKAFLALDECDEVDVIYCVHAAQWRGEPFVDYFVENIAGRLKKPFFVSLIGPPDKSAHLLLKLLDAGIAASLTIDGPLKALRSLVWWQNRRLPSEQGR